MPQSDTPLKPQVSARDDKEHYGVIILGAGVSGLAANIQLQQKLGFSDILCYEKSTEIGGTWNHNRYPGAACDIPLSFYSFSFAPAYNIETQWAGQAQILRYLHEVQDRYKIYNIVFSSLVTEANFSSDSGLWTVKVKDLKTGGERVRTCNVLVSAVGGLANPNLPPFDPSAFDGPVFHSAEWDQSVSLKDKRVVIVGNGCSAAQIVPEIQHEVAKVTQIARSRQAILRRPTLPDGPWLNWCRKHVPLFDFIFRALLFFLFEMSFKVSDTARGKTMREAVLADNDKYMRETVPQKYWNDLQPDFEIATKRRIFDSGYYQSLNNPKVELVQDDRVVSAKGDEVVTKSGKRIPADVVVLCTGFRTQEFLFPTKVTADGISLSKRLKDTNVANFRGTMVQGFPNFFWLMGPNTTTGHSSVIFTTECQITMMLSLVKPVLSKVSKLELQLPGPTVDVKPGAQRRFMNAVRAEMKKKVWEKEGAVSWYVDQDTGLCTMLYPWSQVNFWYHTSWGLRRKDFTYANL
ncbi:hypothetical protein ACM66B_001881 [Microbotryomycetes sp. NB124-2]